MQPSERDSRLFRYGLENQPTRTFRHHGGNDTQHNVGNAAKGHSQAPSVLEADLVEQVRDEAADEVAHQDAEGKIQGKFSAASWQSAFSDENGDSWGKEACRRREGKTIMKKAENSVPIEHCLCQRLWAISFLREEPEIAPRAFYDIAECP